MNNGALERSLRTAPHGAPAAREAGRRAIRRSPPARRRHAIVAVLPARPFADAYDEEDAERERDPSTDPALLEDRTMEK